MPYSPKRIDMIASYVESNHSDSQIRKMLSGMAKGEKRTTAQNRRCMCDQNPREFFISNLYSQVIYLFGKKTPTSNNCLPRAKTPDAVGQDEKHRSLIYRPDSQNFPPSVAESEHVCAVIMTICRLTK